MSNPSSAVSASKPVVGKLIWIYDWLLNPYPDECGPRAVVCPPLLKMVFGSLFELQIQSILMTTSSSPAAFHMCLCRSRAASAASVSGTVCHLSREMIRIPAFTAKELFWGRDTNVELQVDAFDAVSRSSF